MSFLIKGGNVVFDNITKISDVFIRNGVIEKIGENLVYEDVKIIDAKGLTIIPGIVDMHVHFRDPGFCYKENIETGCNAAVAGGVTSVACMPNTSPTVDCVEIISYIKDRAKNSKAKVYPVAAITRGLDGKELVDFKLLVSSGAVGFSDDGRPVENANLLRHAMIETSNLKVPIISHCEDLDIVDGGIINNGKIIKQFGVKGIDRASEDSVTAREVAIAAATGCAIHIAHVSTVGSVDIIRDAKRRGVRVTAETCPHYFMLTEDKLLKKDADYRMNPPLRTEEDRIAIEQAVMDGTIDCIATDHAPHSVSEKEDFLSAPNGVVGLETSLACVLTHFYHSHKMSLMEIVKLMSSNPSKILNITGGKISEGMPADIALVDLNKEWIVRPEAFYSKGKNSAFKGMKLKGKVVKTFCDGKLVFKV